MAVSLTSTTDLIAEAREQQRVAQAAEAELVAIAAAWGEQHPAPSIDEAAVWGRMGGTRSMALAGEGAPLVDEFCIAELAAALGLTTAAGADLVAQALELVHRLPLVWAKVRSGELAVWRARRIAGATIPLAPAAVDHVDRRVARIAGSVGLVVLDRLVTEAMTLHEPERAREEAERASERRRLVVDHRQVTFAGTSAVYGELDLADALDLDAALAAGAAALAEQGCTASLDVRRSMALGRLARGEAFGGVAQRQVVLHVHVGTAGGALARVENGNRVVTEEQVRQWCGSETARIVVRPVLDLAERVHVAAYEVPDRLREQVALRGVTCVFPWCQRAARACDTDHVVPHDDGGPTSSDNLAALCRSHHRLKTHGGWGYTVLEPGTYLWASPRGRQYLRDHTGTREP